MPRRPDNDLPKARLSRESLAELKLVGGYLHPYRFRYLLAFGALLTSSSMALTFPYLAGSLMDSAIHPERVNGMTPNQVVLCLFAALTIQAVFSFFQAWTFATIGQKTLVALRRDTFGHLIRLPITFFDQRRVGELASRISADLGQIEDTLIASVPQFFRQMVLLLGGIVLIFFTSPRLAAVMLMALPIVIVLAVFFGRKLRVVSRTTQDRLAESNTVVEESLQAIRNVKAYGNEGFEAARYTAHLDAMLAVAFKGARYRAAFVSFIILALFGTIVVVLWYGATLLQKGELSGGELTRFVLYTAFVAGAMGQFAELYAQIQKAVGSTQRVRELLGETPEPLRLDTTLPITRFKGEVTFENVSFAYPTRPDAQVLRDISFHARPGERIALVGPSGSGKSTITSLILGFYAPLSGVIRIDGADTASLSPSDLRANTALVPQEVLLFGGTIRENIAYGRPGASEADILEAAKQANAHEFIQSFPEGYATLVGERGVKLSGGQRQRIAIARAILRQPSLLILDEATSSLDSESEKLVHEALDHLMKGRTSFIIAHRLSTVRDADRILVIEHGRIAEHGTHAELTGRDNGLYRRLVELQLS